MVYHVGAGGIADGGGVRVQLPHRWHGQGEYYDPAHPNSYDLSDFQVHILTGGPGTVKGPHTARDAWIAGQRLGAIGSSDDHRAQPGKRGGGLAAVMAPELTRDAIFDAMLDRRAYATTGDRVIVELEIDGEMMGKTVKTAGKPRIEARVIGTGPIAFIELLRFDRTAPDFRTVRRLEPDSDRAEFTWVDEDFGRYAVYYLRMEQENRVCGRVVSAWSSPVWVER